MVVSIAAEAMTDPPFCLLVGSGVADDEGPPILRRLLLESIELSALTFTDVELGERLMDRLGAAFTGLGLGGNDLAFTVETKGW